MRSLLFLASLTLSSATSPRTDVSWSLYEWASAFSGNRVVHLPQATFSSDNATNTLGLLGVNADELGYLYRAARDGGLHGRVSIASQTPLK